MKSTREFGYLQGYNAEDIGLPPYKKGGEMKPYLFRHYKEYYCQGVEYAVTYSLVYAKSSGAAYKRLLNKLNMAELSYGIESCTIE